MTDTAYPRDLKGYGRTPPHPRWPGGARIAVQFVINYEEGGENCILHGDPASEAYLTEIVGTAPLPGQRNPTIESLYEFGSRVGVWRLLSLFAAHRLPFTAFAPMRASEDFGRFGGHARAAMAFLGSGEACPPLHAPDYDFPDALIAPALSAFHRLLRDLCG